jgi:hypothetical protein
MEPIEDAIRAVYDEMAAAGKLALPLAGSAAATAAQAA